MSSNTVITKILELARLDPKYLDELEKFRRPIVVMFTDIHGSTAYFEKHGDAAGLMLVHDCNAVVRRIVEKYGGRLIKTIGDGSMATFDDCGQAVAAAIAMQTTLADMNSTRPPDERASIRVGIHYGIGIVRTNDVFGDVVNVASRVESVAVPEQILISAELQQQVASLGFRILESGRFSLKGKSGERLLFEVLWRQPGEGNGARAAAPQVHAEPSYKFQVVKKDGGVGAEYVIKSGLTLGRSEGDVRFPSDPNMSALHARVLLEDGQVFIEDISDGGESVFVRLSSAYTLQNDDVVIMGNQAFRFHENAALLSAATSMGATLVDLTGVLHESVAEFVNLDPDAKPAKRHPLNAEIVLFGRTKGTYTFPDDKLMSRSHARVLQRGEDFVIEDVGSRNGTFVKVRGKAPLTPGSAILVGTHVLKLIERS